MKEQSRVKKKMLLGLTGSFGSGKTTVAGIFRSFGAKIIDADKIAHRLIRPQTKTYKKIINAFGKGILAKNRAVDRDKLARMVFYNKHLMKRLNRIMHPEVIRVIQEKIRASSGLIVLDAPLLIETGLEKMADKLIVVTTTMERQIDRIRRKTGLNRPEILKRIETQIPLRNKVRLADFVIDNSGTIKKTRKQAQAIRRLLWRN